MEEEIAKEVQTKETVREILSQVRGTLNLKNLKTRKSYIINDFQTLVQSHQMQHRIKAYQTQGCNFFFYNLELQDILIG